jgi:hypothetical protein
MNKIFRFLKIFFLNYIYIFSELKLKDNLTDTN